MAQATQPYKRSLSGSIGSGMKSVLGGNDRRFYVLEHKVSSQYHKAGESQRIIVDQIEIGRGHECQVRFDESFTTVSRRHAAIVKDGDNWKLIQLSQTNSTYLNGRRVEKEWYLQSGDEIQLSTNGPKLGFIVPQGDKGLVKSIGLTARMNLFRQQALRPYKTAISVLSVVMVVAIASLFYWNISLKENFTKQLADAQKANTELESKIESDRASFVSQIDSVRKVAEIADRRARAAESEARKVERARVEENADLSMCHPYVYLIKLCKITVDGEVIEDKVHNFGTGFLLSNGYFVTARHVAEPLYYSNYYMIVDGKVQLRYQEAAGEVYNELYINCLQVMGKSVVYHFKAVSTSDSFSFTSDDFITDGHSDRIHTLEQPYSVHYRNDNGEDAVATIPAGTRIRSGALGAKDFAYIKTSRSGGLSYNSELSTRLKQGTKLYILGYPSGRGEGNPPLSTAVCSQNGLDNDGTIMASNDNTEGGNSGGPIFVNLDSNWEVVAIVSGSTYDKGRFVPINVIR